MTRLVTLLAALLLAAPAFAHRLVIYAYAEAGQVVVESKFSNDRPAVNGSIEVRDAAETVLMTLPIDQSGVTRFAIPEGAADGLTVEVRTDEGHDDYWVLTPDDLGMKPSN